MGCSTSHSNEEQNGEHHHHHHHHHRPEENQMNFMTSSLQKLLSSKNPQDLLQAFVELDKAILEEENKSPSSVFGQAMSRHQQLKPLLQAAVDIKAQNEILSEDCSIHDLFSDLGLPKNPKVVVEHEEFIASINRRAINQNTIKFLQKMLENVEKEIKSSSARISELQSAYQQQDELLGQIFGETYGSETEKDLEKELDTSRYYKDILTIGVLQWEVCAKNVRTAVELLKKAVVSWKNLKNQSLDKKIYMATEARNCIQEAVLLVQTSEELLQDVQFPYCTTRELRGIAQATDYVFSDILLEDRYSHASKVYANFHERTVLLSDWIDKVLNSRLKIDLAEIEDKVKKTANELKNERIYLICRKLKIPNIPENIVGEKILESVQTPVLSNFHKREPEPIDFDSFPIKLESKLGISLSQNGEDIDIQNYFKRIVENRKNTMWPSRRIDELQSLAVRQ